MTGTDSAMVGLVRLSLSRALVSAATAAIAIVWGYAAFVISNSAFATGMLNAAYTLAFAAASSWLATRGSVVLGRVSIAVSALVSAAIAVVAGLLTPLDQYAWLLLLAMVVGLASGVNYPAWYTQLRRGRAGKEWREYIGTYESIRSAAVLVGTVGGGLLAHLLGLELTTVLIGAGFTAGALLALTFPKDDAGNRAQIPGAIIRPALPTSRRVRLLFALLVAVQLLLCPIIALTPVLAVEGVDGGIEQVGLLAGLFGAGSALQFIAMKAVARRARVPVVFSSILAVMLVCAVLAAVLDTTASAGLMMLTFGFGVGSIATLINTEIQTSVPESERDRLVSGFALLTALSVAVGSGVWGLAADFLSVPTIAVISTITTALIAGLLFVVGRRASGSHQDDPEADRSTR